VCALSRSRSQPEDVGESRGLPRAIRPWGSGGVRAGWSATRARAEICLRLSRVSFAVSRSSEYIVKCARIPPASEPYKRANFWWPMAKGRASGLHCCQKLRRPTSKQRVNAFHRARIYRKAAPALIFAKSRGGFLGHAATRARCFASGPKRAPGTRILKPGAIAPARHYRRRTSCRRELRPVLISVRVAPARAHFGHARKNRR